MKVLIVGDVHNKFSHLNALINKKKPDIVIACGDFGYWPKFANIGQARKLSDIKLQSTQKVLWCDGNHEDFWSLRDRESDEIEPGIIYMPRGSTYTLPDGRVIMFMGGAKSIDKIYRKVGVDWFPEEEITEKDFYNLPETGVDIFITHTCPGELVHVMKRCYIGKDFEYSNKALSELWERYLPSLWFFGHWHTYLEGDLDGTKWYALSAAGFGEQWWRWLPEHD